MTSKKEYNKLIEQGNKLLDREEYTQLISLSNKIISIFPKESRPWNLKGLAYLRSNQTEKARKCFREARKINPKDAKYWYNIGISYYREKDYEKSVNYLKKAISLHPDRIEYYDVLALAYLYTNQKSQAKKILLRANKKKSSITILHMLGTLYLEEGNITQYRKIKKKILSSKTKTSETFIAQGTIYEKNNENKKAVKMFEKVTKLDPENHIAWIHLGMIWLKIEPKKAVLIFKKALKINPKDYRLYAYLAQAYLHLDEPTLALKTCSKGLKINSKDAMTWYVHGSSKQLQHSFFESVNSFRKSIKYNPTSVVSWNALCISLIELKKYSEAEKCVNKAIQIEPFHSSTLKSIMAIFPNSKYKKEKINVLQKLVKKDTSKLTIKALGGLLAMDNQYGELVTLFEKYFDMNESTDVLILNLFGMACYEIKDFDSAQKYLKKSTEIDPSNYVSWGELSNVELLLKNIEQAINYMIISVSLNPAYFDTIKNDKKYNKIIKNKRFGRVIKGMQKS